MELGLPLVDFVVIGFYLVLMLGIGFYFSRFMKGGEDFFVGGHLIPWWVGGVSLYMTTFSAWMFTGAASFAYNTGWYGILFFFTQPIGFFIGFQLSAWRWRRTRITSPVEYVQTRFNKTTHLFLSIVLVLSMTYWPAHHLASLSKISAPTMFPNSMMAIESMIVVSGVIILIYTFSGGLWAVAVTDFVQFLILFSVAVVLIPTSFLSGDLGSVGEFLRRVPPLEFNHVVRGNATYTQWYLGGFLLAKVFGMVVGDKAQRFYSVRDEKAARKVGWLAFSLFMTGPILFGIPPLIGKVLWPDISLLQNFSQVTKPDENIYVAVVLRYMPAGVVGIFLSAMMAASMSALDSVWNTVSSIVSVDIYKSLFRPQASDREVLRVGRITVVVLCVLAITMALVIVRSSYGIFTLSNIVLGLTAIPVTIPLLLGILCKRISRWSGIASILAGILMASVARFIMGYSLGPQFLATIGISLLFTFLSNPLGRLYLRSRVAALAVSMVVGSALWLLFVAANTNPDLSLAALHGLGDEGISVLISPLAWATLAAVAFAGLTYGFAILFAQDLRSPQDEVERFFEKLKTPVDVEREVLSRGAKEVNIFGLVGGIAVALSVLSLLILVAPTARTKIGVNLAISGLLFAIGLLMLLSGSETVRQFTRRVYHGG